MSDAPTGSVVAVDAFSALVAFLGVDAQGRDGAGLQAGDRLVKVNGREVASLDAAHKAVADLRPGREMAVVVRRGDQTIEHTLTAGEGF